jgi:hypothetical protein
LGLQEQRGISEKGDGRARSDARLESRLIRIPPRGLSFVSPEWFGLTASCSCPDGMRLIGCAGGPSAGDKSETEGD